MRSTLAVVLSTSLLGACGNDQGVDLATCDDAFPRLDDAILEGVGLEPAVEAAGPLGRPVGVVRVVPAPDGLDTGPVVSGGDEGIGVGTRDLSVAFEPDTGAVRWGRVGGKGRVTGGVMTLSGTAEGATSADDAPVVAIADIDDGTIIACEGAGATGTGDRPVIHVGRGGDTRLVVPPVVADGEGWSVTVPFPVVASTVAGDLVVAAAADGRLAVVERGGRVRWDLPAATVDDRIRRARDHLTVHDDLVLVAERSADTSGDLVAYDLADGAEQWRAPAAVGGTARVDGRAQFSVVDGIVLVHTSDDPDALLITGALRGLDVRTGEQRWSRPTAPPGEPDLGELLVGAPGTVPVPDGVLLVSQPDFIISLLLLDPATGTVAEVADADFSLVSAATGEGYLWLSPYDRPGVLAVVYEPPTVAPGS